MVNILHAEIMKLKRSSLLWLIPLSAVLTALMEYAALIYQQKSTPGAMFNWDWLVFTNFRYASLLISPILFSLFIGYLIALEFREGTINTLFTYSHRRINFLFAKYLLLIPIVFIILLLELLLTLGAGFAVSHPPLSMDSFWRYIQAFLWLTLMTYAFVPVYATVSILGRSYLPNIVFGLVALICGVILVNSPEYGIMFPWSVPILMLNHFVDSTNGSMIDISYVKGIFSLVIVFVVPFIFNIVYYSRMDVEAK
ncbi:ABC transporter permease [Paenibacillus sp.]|jgi:ABC-type transport system involved in multi-copper enzyme maturation permease subunit|uniref:ABC transporter permease n=1 Tax=Paenibacillus sp. TaxID=58172 RepID=UPI002839D66B|nr:ABC transporter permease [Paenibacillus sp.]MDR0267022.1 ABC transporter permease [Paenibacillus sp.]